MMRTKSKLKVFSGKPDLVSLIDLLFLLFIFFLLSASLIFQPGIMVDLPVTHNISAIPVDKVIVTIAHNGKVFLNDRPVADYQLQRQLRDIVEQRMAFTAASLNLEDNNNLQERAPRVIIRADRNVRYEKIVEVMALARSLGLGVYLLTDQENHSSLRLPRGRDDN